MLRKTFIYADSSPITITPPYSYELRSKFGTQKWDNPNLTFFYVRNPEFKPTFRRYPLLQKWDIQKEKSKNRNVKMKMDQIRTRNSHFQRVSFCQRFPGLWPAIHNELPAVVRDLLSLFTYNPCFKYGRCNHWCGSRITALVDFYAERKYTIPAYRESFIFLSGHRYNIMTTAMEFIRMHGGL